MVALHAVPTTTHRLARPPGRPVVSRRAAAGLLRPGPRHHAGPRRPAAQQAAAQPRLELARGRLKPARAARPQAASAWVSAGGCVQSECGGAGGAGGGVGGWQKSKSKRKLKIESKKSQASNEFSVLPKALA